MATRFSTFSRHFSRGLFFHVRIVCVDIYMLLCGRANVYEHFRARLCSVSVCVCMYTPDRPRPSGSRLPATIAADRSLFFILPPLPGFCRRRRAPRIFLCNFFHTHHPSYARVGRLRRAQYIPSPVRVF